VPFDKEMGYRVVEALKEVAGRHDISPARTARGGRAYLLASSYSTRMADLKLQVPVITWRPASLDDR
jgi:hypothetical protein